MAIVKLPRGAEHSYYGGVETKFPLAVFVTVGLFPLDLVLPPGSQQTGFARQFTITVCAALLLVVLLMFLPLLRTAGRGKLDSSHCRKYIPRLATGAVASVVFVAYTFSVGSDLYATGLSLVIVSLWNAEHLRLIKRALANQTNTAPPTDQ